jgi:glutamate decarboxylase
VPAYTFPEDWQDLAALRIVLRNGVSRDLADLVLAGLRRHVDRLGTLSAPLSPTGAGERIRH